MGQKNSKRLNLFKGKMHHENWSTPVFYAPVFLYYLYKSAKFKKLNYFTVVNPALETGGLCGFSKFKSYKLFSPEMVPKTILLKRAVYSEQQIAELLEANSLDFPLIVKPDQGERGFLVSKVEDLRELTETIGSKTLKIEFLIQEYVEGPLELGVFVIRKNGEWTVSSITSKSFLKVVGNGVSSLKSLIDSDARTSKYFDRSSEKYDLDKVPAKGEVVPLEPIGNHCRGTKFVDECYKITAEVNEVFKKLLKNVEGVNYCRLDLRTSSWNTLLDGDFQIMEINGVSAEPGHIYDPHVSLGRAYKDLFSHWDQMADVAKEQIAKGSKSERLIETLTKVKSHMKRKKSLLKVADSIVEVMGYKGLDLFGCPKVLLNKFSAEDLISKHKCPRALNGYERTVLFKNKTHELVFCHWKKGSKTPVHLHPGKACSFRCLRGEVLEVRSMGQKQSFIKAGDVGYIDDSMGAHQVLNISEDCAYSLHLYSSIEDRA